MTKIKKLNHTNTWNTQAKSFLKSKAAKTLKAQKVQERLSNMFKREAKAKTKMNPSRTG